MFGLIALYEQIGVMEQQASAEIKTTQLHSHCKMHGADGEDEPDLQLSNEMLIPIKDQVSHFSFREHNYKHTALITREDSSAEILRKLSRQRQEPIAHRTL